MVAAAELLALWHGDQDSCGYAHPEIAAAMCKLKRPPNAGALRLLFYDVAALPGVPEDLLMILDDGFHVWRERETRRCAA